MSDIFYKYYNDILNDIKFITIKKNNKKTFLQDGILKIKFDDLINCTTCGKFTECEYTKCKHIYTILIKDYKLNFYDLFFLWKNNNYDKLLNNNQFDYSFEDCNFCLDQINYEKNKSYTQCLECGCCYHIKCLRQYDKFNCINCTKNI